MKAIMNEVQRFVKLASQSPTFRAAAVIVVALTWTNFAFPGEMPPPLTIHGTTYVRIKHYFARRDNSPLATTDSAIMLKSFGGALQLSGKDDSDKVGYMLKGMTQTRDENTIAFEFGESVTILQKSDGPPTSWLVSSGSSQAWVPSYILTASKAEVDFLKNNNIIPDSLTFVYGNDLRVWGIGTLHAFRSKVAAYCMGNTRMPLDEDCSQSVGYDGNAVLFDEEAARAIQKPLLSFKISPACIYYCNFDTNAPTFKCIDLSTLKFRK